jgi:hypothetical protein
VFLSHIGQLSGPKLAAFTTGYQAYFDVVQNGQFVKHLNKLYDKHSKDSRMIHLAWLYLLTTRSITGPLVRINPHELHINDSAFIDELFAGSNKNDISTNGRDTRCCLSIVRLQSAQHD